MRSTIILLALSLLSFSCGEGPTNPLEWIEEGEIALGEGDNEEAVRKFEAALDGLSSSDEGYFEAKLGTIRALAPALPDQALLNFQALAAERPDLMRESEYHAIAKRLMLAGDDGLEAAGALAKAGMAAFPDSESLPRLFLSIGKRSEGTAAYEQLQSLGYM